MAIIDIEPVDQVVQGTTEKISKLHSGYTPGSRLPEPKLTAARFGVSVPVAEAAYRVLEDYGWLVVTGRGEKQQRVCARGNAVPIGARPSF